MAGRVLTVNIRQLRHSIISQIENTNSTTTYCMLKNLTPHDVVINGTTYSPSGLVARCKTTRQLVSTIDRISVYNTKLGEVENLPAFDTNISYIVSAMVRTSLPDRKDLFSPGTLVRDCNGKILGCTDLDGN